MKKKINEITNFDWSILKYHSANKSDDDSHNVNSQLELEEFGNGVVDVPAPHCGFDN
jgi:hypothetical protein